MITVDLLRIWCTFVANLSFKNISSCLVHLTFRELAVVLSCSSIVPLRKRNTSLFFTFFINYSNGQDPKLKWLNRFITCVISRRCQLLRWCVGDRWMNGWRAVMECPGVDKSKYRKHNISQNQIFHIKPHTDWLGIEPVLTGLEAGKQRLKDGTAQRRLLTTVQACWTFGMVRKNSMKFGLRAGNIKLNLQNKDRTDMAVITRTVLILKV